MSDDNEDWTNETNAVTERADGRNADGTFRKGTMGGNPGGLTRAQKRIKTMLEDLSEEAVQRLAELMRDPDGRVAIVATKEIIRRVAPPPPKETKIDVNLNLGIDPAAHLATLKAKAAARQRQLKAQAEDAVVIDVTPTRVALAPSVRGERSEHRITGYAPEPAPMPSEGDE